MSRFRGDWDDDHEPEAALARGRWERNARQVLTSKRGRKALADIREALLALPGKRLIEGALCTVGGPDRVPEVTEAEIGAHVADLKARGFWDSRYDSYERTAEFMRFDREDDRDAVAAAIEGQGCGVCLNGALLWHRLVREGMTPGAAFTALPSLAAGDDGGALEETARLAERDAGLTYTLAWELAYRNDETYRGKTPEERYTAFLAWIDDQLAEPARPRRDSRPGAALTA